MVRKWSYLNTTDNVLPTSKLVASCNVYIFKVFRLTTRFKKYKRYKTTFLRKKDKLRKRKTNRFNILRIFADWSTIYIKSRQLIRIYQSFFIFKYNCILYNLNFFNKLILNFNKPIYFNTFFLTKNYKNLYLLNNSKYMTYNIQTKNLMGLSEFSSYNIQFDKLKYNISALLNISNHSFYSRSIFNTLKLTQLHVLLFYKIIIKLTLLKIIYVIYISTYK